MLAALKEMHERGFVHRDVQPLNFMVADHIVKIISLKLSRKLEDEESKDAA